MAKLTVSSRRFRPALVAFTLLATSSAPALACVMKPVPSSGNQGTSTPSPRWRVFKAQSPVPGFVRQELYLNVGLFGPSAPTTCACGFGYSGSPLSGISPIDASLVILDTSNNNQTPYSVFPTLFPNTGATSRFNTVNPAGENLNWLGFSTPGGSVPIINSGNAPVLGPNRFLQLCIRLDIPIAIDALFKTRLGCVLGAEADPNGVPLPFPQFPHGLDPQEPSFGPDPERIIPAPGAGAAALIAGGLLMLSRRRR